jgi:hypothetical protein
VLAACAKATQEDLPSGGDDSGSGGTSGASASGGTSNPTGGVGASGGVTPTGGNGASGGTSGKGGSEATGGTSGKGGSDATGGASGSSGSGAGKGGSAPFGGAGGMSGAGRGGAAGQGGTGGAGGGAGGAGGGPVDPPTGECAIGSTLELRYKVNQTGDSIAFDLRLTNLGMAPISANQIEFQYYISQEESAWQDRVLDVYAIQSTNYMDLKTTGVITVDPLMPEIGMQTHVVRIRQTGGALLPPGASSYLNITARLQPNPSAPAQVQTNDFSYDAAHTMLALWDQIAVFVNGTLAWGCTPET